KKAVADKKRRQACRRPPPVCDSRQLNSRLKNFYPISLIISVELMMYRFNHQYTQLGFFWILRYALNDEFGITLPPSQNLPHVMQSVMTIMRSIQSTSRQARTSSLRKSNTYNNL
ncbi:MAG: hypothetical protein IJW31_08500, partial [Lentisphaeria bacterium]|nr:hypothetical protein [Lentisphaeria bacterium]